MIIWSGWGILVVLIVFISSFLMELIVESVTGNSNFYQQYNWPLTLALILSGVACWFLGKYLNKPIEKIMIDKETGNEVRLRNAKHRLFLIKMEYWGPILIIIGLITLFR